MKMWYIFTVECYSAIRKKEMLPFLTIQMGLGDVTLGEISQTQEDKYCIFYTKILKRKKTLNSNKRVE